MGGDSWDGVQEIAVSQLVHVAKERGERNSGGRPDKAVHRGSSVAHSAALLGLNGGRNVSDTQGLPGHCCPDPCPTSQGND